MPVYIVKQHMGYEIAVMLFIIFYNCHKHTGSTHSL